MSEFAPTRVPMLLLLSAALGITSCAKGGSAGQVDADVVVVDAPIAGPDAPGCNGLPCDAIYVARRGNNNNAGSKDAPVLTISAGILKAKASNPPKAVFVAGGAYSEQVVMAAGVSVYGGFNDSWARTGAATTLTGDSPVITFRDINAPTALDTLVVRSNNAVMMGQSTIAIVLQNAKQIELRTVTATAGDAGAGLNGSDGVTGGVGSAGGTGIKGCEDSSSLFCSNCTRPAGGGGGASACGRTGGSGG